MGRQRQRWRQGGEDRGRDGGHNHGSRSAEMEMGRWRWRWRRWRWGGRDGGGAADSGGHRRQAWGGRCWRQSHDRCGVVVATTLVPRSGRVDASGSGGRLTGPAARDRAAETEVDTGQWKTAVSGDMPAQSGVDVSWRGQAAAHGRTVAGVGAAANKESALVVGGGDNRRVQRHAGCVGWGGSEAEGCRQRRMGQQLRR